MSTVADRGAPPPPEDPGRDGVTTGGRPPSYAEMQASPQFQELRHKLRGFIFPATAAFLAWYLLYVILSGWARGFMGTKLFGAINVAYVFGLLQFVTTFLIAYLYYRYATSKIDPIADDIYETMEGRK